MMSMVPEGGSLTPSEIQPTNKSPTPPAEPTPTPRKRAVETLNNIKTIGSISASSDQIHKTSSSIQSSGNYTLPRFLNLNSFKTKRKLSTLETAPILCGSFQDFSVTLIRSYVKSILENIEVLKLKFMPF